jgi:hypothetical protein
MFPTEVEVHEAAANTLLDQVDTLDIWEVIIYNSDI